MQTPLGKPFPCTSLCSFIMDSVADGLFTVDREWNIIYFSQSAAGIVGLPAEKAVGRKCWQVFRTEGCTNGDSGHCVLRQCIAEDRKIVGRILMVEREDGVHVPVSVSAAPLKDRDGTIIGGVESFRDLSSVPGKNNGRKLPKGFCSRDPNMAEILRILPQVAESEATVLLLGESGTGKEFFARAIHELSPRHNGPFVAVNCGALPEQLMESELFGYKAGAFTDARRDKPGRFQLAEGGTILLDEIGDLPQPLQAKILRVLQERVFEPLGGVAGVPANVRVIAATNRDLERMTQEGSFRQDLYFRLNVVRMTLPPLRERRGDIPLLVDMAIKRRQQNGGKHIQGLSQEAMRLLLAHSFPGNIRELENIIEYASILCPGGLIHVEHLPADVRTCEHPAPRSAMNGQPMTMAEIRYHAAVQAVERNGGNRNAACRELGITKDTLRRILGRVEDNSQESSNLPS
ncbi:PAS domain S-box-containing protein [Humidesulfovibrio mexicanus]|uniref:PAS domain S-box-containing protein n=1 Tax=Humidesulfovibrio mexicanus TaxID=147047 RepID=A0A239BQN8_9BACT|nr:sigma 54-interacting transcriptional regulator [Humidesulfovibrio mexicanus]SNS09738.1 PAS domain S-box-containing protein [Humidesulfovibrio mexicanus]